MGIHQGGVPHEPRGGDSEPSENFEDFSLPQSWSGRFDGDISPELTNDAHREMRMEVDIRSLVEAFAEGQTVPGRGSVEAIHRLREYFDSTPLFDKDELKRRLHVSKDRVLEEITDHIPDSARADSCRNLLVNLLIQRSASKLAEFEITHDLQFSHELFSASTIEPFVKTVDSAIDELTFLKRDPKLVPAQLKAWANERLSSIVEQKQTAIDEADSWNQGYPLAASMAVRHVLNSFEEQILPPIKLGGSWQLTLGAFLTNQFAEGVENAAVIYHEQHKDRISDAFNRLEAALPPMIRLA